MPPQLEIALRILTALGALTGVVMLLRIRVEKRKIKAETVKTEIDAAAAMAGTALSLIDPLREEIALCRAETLRLKQQVERTDE